MTELNIYQKLIEVRKSCPYLKQDNKGYDFSYVSSSQTLGTLRAKMDEMQLLLVPQVISYEVRDHTTKKGDHQYFTILKMEFMWVNAENPTDSITCQWTGQGVDAGEKGVGKAVTYAEKYFLLKFFNIATDKDDPDSFQGAGKGNGQTGKPPQQDKTTPPPSSNAPPSSSSKATKKATDPQRRMIWAKMKAAEIDEETGKRLCTEVTNKESSKDWTMEDIDKIVKYIEAYKEIQEQKETDNEVPSELPYDEVPF